MCGRAGANHEAPASMRRRSGDLTLLAGWDRTLRARRAKLLRGWGHGGGAGRESTRSPGVIACRPESSGLTGMDKRDATPTRAATRVSPAPFRNAPIHGASRRSRRGDSNPRPHHYERFARQSEPHKSAHSSGISPARSDAESVKRQRAGRQTDAARRLSDGRTRAWRGSFGCAHWKPPDSLRTSATSSCATVAVRRTRA